MGHATLQAQVSSDDIQDIEEIHIALFDHAARRCVQMERARRLHGQGSDKSTSAENRYRRARRILGMFPGRTHIPGDWGRN